MTTPLARPDVRPDPESPATAAGRPESARRSVSGFLVWKDLWHVGPMFSADKAPDAAIWERRVAAGVGTGAGLMEAIREGAVLRVRPKAMTVCVIIAGLLPILLGGGTGSEIMGRIAAPMVGGMITAPLLSLVVIPAVLAYATPQVQNRTHSIDS